MYNPKHHTMEEKMGKGEVEGGIHISVYLKVDRLKLNTF